MTAKRLLADMVCGLLVLTGTLALRWRRRTERRFKQRQERAAQALGAIAAARRWLYVQRDLALEQGWIRPPFSLARSLWAVPAAYTGTSWGRLGLAYIEADVSRGRALTRFFTSRVVWAEVGARLPDVTFMREDFATWLVKRCGGSDLDVESYAFNRLWRVRTDDPRAVHGMLQPTMIALLTDLADEGISFHLDGHRVLLWDDGRDATVDLEHRVELIQRFVAALPSFLRPNRGTADYS
jgi:hypothetical protein